MIELLPKQLTFLNSTNKVLVFRASIRSGKSVILCLWAIIRALQKRTVMLVEPTNQMCTDVIIPIMYKLFESLNLTEEDVNVKMSKPHNIEFKCGGKIMLRSAESIERIRGTSLHDIGFDEYCLFKDEKAYKIGLGRLSESKDGQIRMTSSPTVVKWAQELEKKQDVEVITQTMMENYFLPIEYINTIIEDYGVGSLYYRQEILGEFVSFEDGIFDTAKLKIITNNVSTNNKRFVRAWDTASSDKTSADYTASVLLSIDDNGEVIVHDVWRAKGSFANLQSQIINIMNSDLQGTTNIIENTSAGQVILSILRADTRLNGVFITPVNASTDKVTRALPISGKVAGGHVSIIQNKFTKDFTDELESFGKKHCVHDDMVDAFAHAFNWIAIKKGSGNIKGLF